MCICNFYSNFLILEIYLIHLFSLIIFEFLIYSQNNFFVCCTFSSFSPFFIYIKMCVLSGRSIVEGLPCMLFLKIEYTLILRQMFYDQIHVNIRPLLSSMFTFFIYFYFFWGRNIKRS